MDYLFDGIIFSLILLAVSLSKEPKRTAIIICIFVSLTGFFLNKYAPIEVLYSGLYFAEFMGAMMLIVLAYGVPDKIERRFFYLMSGLLLVSGSLSLFLTQGLVDFGLYTYCYQGISIAHVLTMLALSDGLSKFFRDSRDLLFSFRRNIFNS